MVEYIFWFSFFSILYTYIGYPFILSVWRRMKKKTTKKGEYLPSVSIILAVYNEEKLIERKLRNLLELDYPAAQLEIIVSSDGSTDQTEEKVARFKEEAASSEVSLRFMGGPDHVGKAAALNRAVEHARGEIILFSDARQILDRKALLSLVSNFSDPKVGVASGELVLVDRPGGDGVVSVGLYWRYEKWLRKMESDIDSMLGATGALYAIRKSLYRPIPADTILDDVLIPMQAVFEGYRIIFESEAMAYDFVPPRPQTEFVRKVRTLAGNYQLLWENGSFWSPKKNRIFFQYFSHKVARLVVPFLLVILFFSNLFLLKGFYLVFLILQLAWYGLALIGGISYEKMGAKAS
jgi:cellulose synthase/poly-beta-1,6-N-acetylglucosamine synthase-like glycosyltransferase